MLRRLSLSLVFGSVFAVHAAPKDFQVRFEDLPKLVKERNENVAGARQSEMAARERTGYLKRSFLPSLSARVGRESAKIGTADRENLGFWSAEGRVNLFRGGRDKLEGEIIDARARASGAKAIKDYLTELKSARDSYWHLAATQLLVTELKDAIAKNQENIKGAKRRAGAGVTTGADSLHFELENTNLAQDLKKMEHDLDVLKNRLSVQIGHPDHKQIKIVAQFPHPPEAEFQEVETDMQKSPDLNLMRESAEIEKLGAEQASRWYLPRLDAYARHGIPTLGEDYTLAIRKETETVVGIDLSLDLGQVFHDRVAARAQTLESRAVASRISQKTKIIQATGHELQHDLKLLHELIHDADRDVEKAQNFLKLTQSEYTRGVKNGPDLLEAFSKLYGFRKRKIELNLEYQLAKAELESLTSEVNPL